MGRIYLVTGAAGNVGSHVVQALLARGERVRALVLPGDAMARRLPEGVELVEGNILNPDDLERFFAPQGEGEQIVIHTAGIVSIGWHAEPQVQAVNVQGTRNVVESCVRHQVRRLVYTASVHAICEEPGGETILEPEHFDAARVVGFYGKTKAQASGIVLRAAREQGLDACLVYPSGICGPGDYARGHITQLLIDAARGKLPAGVRGGYDFVDVRDVAEGVLACCELGAPGEGYILCNRYVSVRELLDLVHELAGAKRVRCMLPAWAVKPLLPAFGLYAKLRRERPLFTRYSLYTLGSNANFSNEKARRVLGYHPRPFRETVSDTLHWLRRECLI